MSNDPLFDKLKNLIDSSQTSSIIESNNPISSPLSPSPSAPLFPSEHEQQVRWQPPPISEDSTSYSFTPSSSSMIRSQHNQGADMQYFEFDNYLMDHEQVLFEKSKKLFLIIMIGLSVVLLAVVIFLIVFSIQNHLYLNKNNAKQQNVKNDDEKDPQLMLNDKSHQ